MASQSSPIGDKDAEEWGKDWKEMGDQVPWQTIGPHKGLVNNITALTNGKPSRRVLVPLCGASDDLVWLADQGHTVVGIEVVRDAIKLFFDRNKLEYEVSAVNIAPSGAYMYKAKDKNITIVEVNFWNFNKSIAGDFDAVWDRGALIAVLCDCSDEQEVQLGKKYLKIIKDALKPDGRVLMETIIYDPKEKAAAGGPGPHLLSTGNLKAMCKESWSMETIEMITVKAGEEFQRLKMPYNMELNLHSLIPR